MSFGILIYEFWNTFLGGLYMSFGIKYMNFFWFSHKLLVYLHCNCKSTTYE